MTSAPDRFQWERLVLASGLPSATKLVALAFATHVSRQRQARPGTAVLARLTGLHRVTVVRCLAELEAQSLLTVVARGGGRGRATTYLLSGGVQDVASATLSERERARLAGQDELFGDEPQTVAPGYGSSSERVAPGNRLNVKTVVLSTETVASRNTNIKEHSELLTNVRSSGARAPTRRGTRIPDDFAVTPELAEWAEAELPGFDFKRETAAFIDYWRALPGTKAVKLDWPATWRNWMRRTARSESRGRPQPRDSIYAESRAREHPPRPGPMGELR